MNFFDKHIGDWIKDTVSLSMLEEGAYGRLIDQYYQTEHPLPLDKKEIYRMARATSTPERKAVDYVLAKYFALSDEGYRQKRCDEQIEEYWERDQSAETRRENDKERQRRARERRKQLFEALRLHGMVPDFNTPTKQLAVMLNDIVTRDEESDEGGDDNAGVTRDNTATHYPPPTSQSPLGVNTTGDTSTVVGAICVGLRRSGVQVSPHQLQVQELAKQVEAQTLTVQTILAAGEDARKNKPNERIGIGLVVAILTSWATKAKAMNVAGARPPASTPSSRDAQRAGAMNSIGLGGQQHDAQPTTIDAATGDIVG